MRSQIILLLITVLFFLSCNNSNRQSVSTWKPGKKEITELNTYLIQKDRERILNYIERKNLVMKESASGLWYCIKGEGTGSLIKDFDRVVMDYECSLLDGTLCYSSKKEGRKEIVLGRSELESGLYEGLKMLKPGGEACFILPPFLAFGIIGDNKAIPPRSILVYDVKVIKEK